MPDLTTTYLGLALKNPLVPSSTPLSHDLDAVLHLEDAGAAAIVMHSLFEEDVRNDELMIDRFLVNPDSFGEAAGHLPFGQGYQSELDGYLEQIQLLKSRLGIPVVASLNGSSLSGWVELGREMQEAGLPSASPRPRHWASSSTAMATHRSSPAQGNTPWGACSFEALPMRFMMCPFAWKSSSAGAMNCWEHSAWARSMYWPSPVRRRWSRAARMAAAVNFGAM